MCKLLVPADAQLSLSAYCTVYCEGESARKAMGISGRLMVPCFDFDNLRSGFNNILILCLYICCFIVTLMLWRHSTTNTATRH